MQSTFIAVVTKTFEAFAQYKSSKNIDPNFKASNFGYNSIRQYYKTSYIVQYYLALNKKFWSM